MKFCTYCGSSATDDARFCVNCGRTIKAPSQYTPPIPQDNQIDHFAPQQPAPQTVSLQNTASTLRTAAKVFMILGCILSAFMLFIPLLWTIPMTVVYCNAVNNNRSVGVGFKICSLLFVSQIGGILMLCDNK